MAAGYQFSDAELDEAKRKLYETLGPKAGLAPPQAPPVPDAAPEVAATPQPPSAAPVAPQSGMNPTVREYLSKQLGPEFAPEAFAKAQADDRDASTRNRMMESGRGILAAMGNVPHVREPFEQDASQKSLGATRGNLLGSLQAAGTVQQFQTGMEKRDPGSQVSKRSQLALLTQAPDLAKAFGGVAAISQMSAEAIEQALGSVKGIGEAQKPAAEVGKLSSDTRALDAMQEAVSPEHVAALAKAGITLPSGSTYAHAKDIVDQQDKGLGRQIDWAKLALERGKTGMSATSDLRKEFQNNQVYKDTQQIAASYAKIKSASASGAGDISLVYGYMKLLDPGSAVREGEYATAANAGSAFQKVGALYNKVLTGEKLPTKVREQFKTEAGNVYNAAMGRYDSLAVEYRRLAKQQGVPEADVVTDIGREAQGPKRITSEAEYDALPFDALYVDPDGVPRKKTRKP